MKSSKMTRWFLSLCTVAAFMVAFSVPAHAVPTLRLTSGANTIDITDAGANDQNLANGAVTFIGSLGAWTLNVSTGISKPALGDEVHAEMDLNSVNVSTGAAELTILFSDTDFVTSPTLGSIVMNIGGTTVGLVSAEAYYDDGNTLFAKTTQIDGTLGPFGAGAFSGSASGPFTTQSFYSLTQVVKITHTRAGGTSFDFEIQAIPEPGTILLLGSGLVGLAFMLKRKRSL